MIHIKYLELMHISSWHMLILVVCCFFSLGEVLPWGPGRPLSPAHLLLGLITQVSQCVSC